MRQLSRTSFIFLWAAVLKFTTIDAVTDKSTGDESCPCLSSSDLSPVDVNLLLPGFDSSIDFSTYGIGCAPHDANTTVCSSESGSQCDTTNGFGGIPLPVNDCQRSWCARSWCFVDTRNCQLLHKPSYSISNQTRFYSYATCGHMDSFTDDARLASLRGKVMRVGYNSNSGGWTGAYHPDGHFATSANWYGPTVNFVTQAALRGGYTINITKPPDWLAPLAQEYYGTTSKFDLCVYAATLGYLDFCVADYTITDKRAAATTFFLLQNKPLYLITFEAEQTTSFESFAENFKKIFAPFTAGVWCLILFVVLPLVGLLMIYHEYGAKDGSFPKQRTVIVTDQEGSEEIQSRKIHIGIHVFRALYASTLGFFQQSYGQRIVTIGGKFNLLGISFFILTIVTLYTSNLAAILVQESRRGEINSLDDAISAGYKICATRKAAELVMEIYDVGDQIVVDPPSIGGDGLPGFSCCGARQRVFDFMANPNPDGRLYCDAAITIPENLDQLQRSGTHCNKTVVGTPIAFGLSGLPIHAAVAEPLTSLFLALRNEGVMRKEVKDAQPTSKCSPPKSEGDALTIADLAAVWVITFAFAFLGLIAKAVKNFVKKRKALVNKRQGAKIISTRSVARFDQWGPLGDPGVETSCRTDSGVVAQGDDNDS